MDPWLNNCIVYISNTILSAKDFFCSDFLRTEGGLVFFLDRRGPWRSKERVLWPHIT